MRCLWLQSESIRRPCPSLRDHLHPWQSSPRVSHTWSCRLSSPWRISKRLRRTRKRIDAAQGDGVKSLLGSLQQLLRHPRKVCTCRGICYREGKGDISGRSKCYCSLCFQFSHGQIRKGKDHPRKHRGSLPEGRRRFKTGILQRDENAAHQIWPSQRP